MFLEAGNELRCRKGSVLLRIGATGGLFPLPTGQAFCLSGAGWVTVEAPVAATISVQAFQPQTLDEAQPTQTQLQAQKNRQGFSSLWRWCAERLSVRRGPRAA